MAFMPMIDESRVRLRRCPTCGRLLPLDWFGPVLKGKVKEVDAAGREVEHKVRYRKYADCWSCREHGRSARLAQPSRGEGSHDVVRVI